MSFARPLLLLALAVVPLWWWLKSRRVTPGARYSDVKVVGRVNRNRAWVSDVPMYLRSAVLCMWIIAAAGPQRAISSSDVTSEGISIVLAVDVSSSMLAEDFTPSNRLDVAREQSIRFILGRENDRIGLVAFAAEALTRVPITIDHAVLRQSVAGLRVGELEDGTAIGTAIATAANRLRRAPGLSKVVVLLTDGDNNRGTIDPRTAAEAAAALGVRIYTIGVGTEGEARMPIGRGVGGSVRYQRLQVRLDEDLLRNVAESTGGRYFRATDADALSRIFGQIDELEKTEVEVTRYTQMEEVTRFPLMIGMLLLGVELVLGATVIVRVP